MASVTEETKQQRKVKEYGCDTIVVEYEPRRCIHSEHCIKGLPQVFDTKARPWIQPANATADLVAKTVEQCPSGALHYRRLDGASDEQVPDEVTIVPQPDGPLYVRGRVRIVEETGEVREDVRVALCRCGHSSTKPYCDGSHERIGFRSSAEPEPEVSIG
jgi:uncharacterized Fe-S cluster protein YjdI/CDGSH-type Zn-finger protein